MSRIIFLLALLVCSIFTALNFSRMPSQVLALPYLTCDEASVVRAADTIAQDGYTGFRCHEVFTGSCYGGTQAFLDGLTISLLPEKIKEAGRLMKPPGERWLWLTENSPTTSLLRLSRVLYAALALIFFFWAGKGLPLTTRLLLATALGSSWSFVDAWLGVKNDYPSLLFLFLFVYCLKRFSELPSEKRTLTSFLPVFILGNLGIWVRIPMLIPVCLGAIFFLAGHFQKPLKIKIILRDAVILLSLTLGAYLLLHPNIFYSSTEMHWMDSTLFIGRAPSIGLYNLATEFRLLAFSCWPLLFIAFPTLHLIRKRSSDFQDWYMIYLLIAAITMEALIYQKMQGRSYYYLAGTGLSFFALQNFWQSRGGPSKRALILFSILALLSTLFGHLALHQIHTRGYHMDTGPSDALTEEVQLANFLNDDAQSDKEIAVDRLLQPVIFEKSNQSRKIVFFDSLSESPGELRKRLGSSAKIIVTCWSNNDERLADEFHSEPGKKWQKFLQGRCTEYQSITPRHVTPFISYIKTSKFIILDLKDLPAAESPRFLDRHGLNPRMLLGAEYGDDHYDALLRLKGSKSLTGSFTSKIKAQNVELSFYSTCKEEGSLTMRIDVDGKNHQASISSDISEDFCRDYDKKICEWPWFRSWSQKRYAKNLSLKNVKIHPGSSLTLSLDRLAPKGNDCPVLLNMIRFSEK